MAILACDMVYCCCKGLYFTPSEKPNSPGMHTHTHTHTLPMLKLNLRGLSPDCPPPRESVDLAKSALMDDRTEQTSVYWSSELCAA